MSVELYKVNVICVDGKKLLVVLITNRQFLFHMLRESNISRSNLGLRANWIACASKTVSLSVQLIWGKFPGGPHCRSGKVVVPVY